MKPIYVAISFLLLAGITIIAQTVFLLCSTNPDPMIVDWMQGYRLSSSLRTCGVAAVLIACAVGLCKCPRKKIFWASFLIILYVTWHDVVNALWGHYVDLSAMYRQAALPLPSYFSFDGSLAETLRIISHILIPIALCSSAALLFKKDRTKRCT